MTESAITDHSDSKRPDGQVVRGEVLERRRLEQLVAELSGAFVRVSIDDIDDEVNLWLKRLVLTLGLDRSTIAAIDPKSGWAGFTHGWAREKAHVLQSSLDPNVLIPWLKQKVLAGQTVVIPSIESLPEEAAIDRASMLRYWPR